YGFEEYAEMVAEWTPEKTSEVTWVAPEEVREAARLIGMNSPAILQWGVALDQREDCVDGSRAVLSLFALTGNIEKPGSMIVGPELLKYITGWGRDLLSFDAEDKRIGADDLLFYKLALQVASMNKLIDHMIEQPEDYPIKASWIQTVNQIACGGADNARTLEAFGKLEFNVIVDLFMTPTAMAYGDLFLPVTTFAERNGIRCGDGTQRGETINAAVAPRGECRSDMEINLELGRRFNPEAWPWETVEEMFTHIMAETGMDFEGIREIAPSYLPFEYEKFKSGKMREDGEAGFQTPSGRLEIYSQGLNFLGYDPLPRYVEPPMTPYSQPELAAEYPLVLTTGARRPNTFHSENRQGKRLRALHPEPAVQIHPQTAASLGVHDGDWVWVEGPVGLTGRTARAKRVAEVTPIVDPRVVSTDHGWWRPEADPENLYDVNELNINNLISWSSGQTGIGANYKCLLCKVYPCKDGE
ncbi:MAG: molybdopterin-dependent oxidoreductase, partial [Eggerthellaceae bacterium]|nr:molybdopterin-dependent oxidoreductase [Eggerthellaceae bacterium]